MKNVQESFSFISKYLSAELTAIFLLLFASNVLAQTVECGNDSLFSGCGELTQVTKDSFVIDFSSCIDLRGRNRGLVIRLDTEGKEGKTRCQIATRLINTEDVNLAPGFYRVRTDIEYNVTGQVNESFYLEVVDSDTTGPCDTTNVRNFLVVVPDRNKIADQAAGSDSVRIVRDAGLFFFNSGETILLKHYQLLLDPTVTPNPTKEDSALVNEIDGVRKFGSVESVHLFTMTLKRVAKESVLKLTKTADRQTVSKG